MADANSQGLAECVGRVRNCLRCPVVSSETGYRLYVSLGHPEADWQSRGVSDSTLLQLTTGDVTPPRSAAPALPFLPLHMGSMPCRLLVCSRARVLVAGYTGTDSMLLR